MANKLDPFDKLILWMEVGDSPEEDDRTIEKRVISPEGIEENLLRLDGALYKGVVIHEDDEGNSSPEQPANSIFGTISISLAEKLGLEWYKDDEGESCDDDDEEGNKMVFKVIAVYLVLSE